MKRRAWRTYINTEYLPEIEEDAIESNDPQELERMTHGCIDDVVRADRERFKKLCKEHGYDFDTINKEYERKKTLEKRQRKGRKR